MHLVPVPRDLPVQRGALSVGALAEDDRRAVEAVLAADAPGAVVEADNLELLRSLPDACVDLVYADPPFATGGSQRLTSIRTGSGEGTRGGFGGRTYRYEVVSDMAWADDLPLDQHLEALHARLVEVHRVLTADGSLYLHVDWRTAHHVRLLLDEVFGPERFLNEIVWAYDYGGRARDRWPRKHDTILWYAKGDAWTFEREAIDRIPYLAPGLVGPEKAARGKLPTDVWWMTIVPPGSAERTGYPTQKPVRLLERIVAASSRPGELVLDPYAGSGTTGVAAARLGRRWLLVDRNPAAVEIARARLAGGGRDVTARPGPPHEITAITLDFGNTLVPVPASGLREVVGRTAQAMAERLGPFDVEEVRRVWAEERERQFREEVPLFRETDLGQRIARVLARLRGMAPPPADRRWDDDAAAALTSPGRGRMDDGGVLGRLRRRAPAAAPVGRSCSRGWPVDIGSRSCRTGRSPSRSTATRTPRAGRRRSPRSSSPSGSARSSRIPRCSPQRRSALGDPEPSSILHVGDDWAADVVGARRAGWRAAYLLGRPDDSPLPGSEREGDDPALAPDLELASLDDLEAGLERLRR